LFTLLLAGAVGAVGGLLPVSYLPLPISVLFVLTTLILAILLRLTGLYVDREVWKAQAPRTNDHELLSEDGRL
jgi:hypothetical protein